MKIKFAGSKAASVTAGVLFVLVVAAMILIVGGDSLWWDVKNAPARVARYTQTAFPLLWEYKIHLLTFIALVLVLRFVRSMHDGPVKKF